MAQNTYETITFENKEGIGIIKFNRKDKINLLNKKMLYELNQISCEAINKAEENEIKGLVITGSYKGFAAGLDLQELIDNYDQYEKYLNYGRNGIRNIENLPIPSIAAVNIAAIGGGLEIALACDFIYSEYRARLGFPETKFGLIPGAGGTVLLPRKIGESKAKDLIYSGKIINAEEAEKIGLVDKLCSGDELLQRAIEYLKEIPVDSLLSNKFAKKSIEMKSYCYEQKVFDNLRMLPEVKRKIENYLQNLRDKKKV